MFNAQRISAHRPPAFSSKALHADIPGLQNTRPRSILSLGLAGLVIIGLVAWVTGCGKQPKTEVTPVNEASTTIQTHTAAHPRIWHDEEMEELVKSFGYDEAHVIRWQNCVVEGWVEFDGEKGAKRVSLNSSNDNIKQIDQKDSTSNELAPRGKGRAVSGWIAVAMRKDPQSSGKAYQCRVEQRSTYEYETGKASSKAGFTFPGLPAEGRVLLYPPDELKGVSGPVQAKYGDDKFELLKYRDGKNTPWLQLHIATSTQ